MKKKDLRNTFMDSQPRNARERDGSRRLAGANTILLCALPTLFSAFNFEHFSRYRIT